MTGLEVELVSMCKTRRFDLATAAFIASGIKDKEELSSYLDKFEKLVSVIDSDERVCNAKTGLEKAEAVFDWLWKSKPGRYNDSWKITDALDNQVSESKDVGNCTGLTLLYNSICQRLGIDVKAVLTTNHMYSAIDLSAIFSGVYIGGTFPIENTSRKGFGSVNGYGKIIENKQLICITSSREASDCQKKEEFGKAFSFEETALRITPDDPRGRFSRFFLSNELSRLAEKSTDLDGTISAYRRILDEHPAFYQLAERLAKALTQRNEKDDLSEAVFLCEKSIDLREKAKDFSAYEYFNLGDKYMAARRFDSAAVAFQKAVNLNPKDAFYWYCLGRSFDEQGKYDEAIAQYEKAKELDPADISTDFRLRDAKCALKNKETKEPFAA